MSRALITESYLTGIANAIRAKLGVQNTYTPPQMAAAIESIPEGGITPTGTKNITQNGTHDVTQYASANVNVQPNLQSKTATENGTVTPDQGYDGLSQVVVNVSGGGGEKTALPLLVTAESTYIASPQQPYNAFGDVEGRFWGAADRSSWLNINFTAPYNLKKVRLANYYRVSSSTYWYSSNIEVRASNDGFGTYTVLYTGTGIAQSDTQFEINLSNNNAYLEYRLILSDTTAYVGLGRITLI